MADALMRRKQAALPAGASFELSRRNFQQYIPETRPAKERMKLEPMPRVELASGASAGVTGLTSAKNCPPICLIAT
jgi:hypothetical protein